MVTEFAIFLSAPNPNLDGWFVIGMRICLVFYLEVKNKTQKDVTNPTSLPSTFGSLCQVWTLLQTFSACLQLKALVMNR